MERRGLDLPLLIGGATTSRQHTAVRIAPAYGQPRDPRGRRLPRGRRGLGAARSRAEGDARRSRTASCRRVCAPSTRSGRRPRCSPYRIAAERRTPIAWDAADLAEPAFTGARVGRAVARGAPAVHRLDLLLRGLGAEGLVPADPRAPSLRRAGARAARRRERAPRRDRRARLDPGARHVRLLAGAQRGGRHRPGERRDAPDAPPAGGPRGRPSRTARSRTSSRPWSRGWPTTSARSRSRPASAPTSS